MKTKYIMTICGYNPSQKTALSLIKILLVLMKKKLEVLDELQVHRISKGGKENKLWQKLFDQQ